MADTPAVPAPAAPAPAPAPAPVAAAPAPAPAPATPAPAAPQPDPAPVYEVPAEHDDKDPSRLPVALRPCPAGPSSERLVRPGSEG